MVRSPGIDRSSARRAMAILTLTALVGALLVAAPASAGGTRHASPTGSGSACTDAAPCDVTTALEGAFPGATVIIPGDEGPYAIPGEIHAAPGIAVNGTNGRPELVFAAGGLNLYDAHAKNLRITANGATTAFRLRDGAQADRIFVHQSGSGHACYLAPRGSLRSSVCWADGTSDLAIETDGSTTLRNVVAYGGTEAAILVYGRDDFCQCHRATLTMVNTIARSTYAGFDLLVESDGSAEAWVRPTYSNFRTRRLIGGSGNVKLVASDTNQTARTDRPKFIGAATGNFRAAPGAPQIDLGTTAAANGDKDLDGRPRKVGTRTDVGASEYSPPQTTITAGPKGTITDETPTFRFTSSRAGSTFQCKVDGGLWLTCTSPANLSLAFGAHTFRVRATDPLGYVDPTPAKRSITILP